MVLAILTARQKTSKPLEDHVMAAAAGDDDLFGEGDNSKKNKTKKKASKHFGLFGGSDEDEDNEDILEGLGAEFHHHRRQNPSLMKTKRTT